MLGCYIHARHEARKERMLELRDHSLQNVVGDLWKGISTRAQLKRFSEHQAHISMIEPNKVWEALEDSDWVEAMHKELNNFERNKVRKLVEKPKDCRNVIGTKWIFKNKQDEHGIIVRNKARLVTQVYSQIEGIDYGETYAPVARLESICILLAYAAHHNFKLQQMDVESAFLYGPLNWYMLSNPRDLRIPTSQTMSTNLIRRSMGSSKPHARGMSTLDSYCLTVALRLGKSIPLFLLIGLMGSFLYAKYMLMILSLAHLTKLLMMNSQSL